MVDKGIDRYMSEFNRAMEKDRFGETYPGTILTKMTVEKLADEIQKWRDDALSGKRGRRNRSAVLIEHMDPQVVAFVTIRLILGRLYRRQPLTEQAVRVGKAIMDEARFQEFNKQAPALYRKIDKTARQNAADNDRRRKVLIYSMNKFDIPFKEWPKTARLQLGMRLIELLRDVSGFFEIISAPTPNRSHLRYIIIPTDTIIEFVKERNEIGKLLRPDYLPTVMPPREWYPSDKKGGYHFVGHDDQVFLVKYRYGNRNTYHPGEMTMPLVFQGLNAIQSTPWRINRDILSVMSTLWETDRPLPGLHSREDIPVPKFPEDGTDDAKKTWRLEARRIRDENAKSKGRRVKIGMCLSLADEFKSDEAIYFPHRMDFRGRVYPIGAAFTPQGSDFERSLIEFAEGKRLADYDAVKWLAIHGANVWGEDKVDFDDRLQWVQEHEDEILWCAEDPLRYEWWHEADKPFSFLAFCLEWAGYKRNGLDHVSRIPIAMDGTCNGLQHFSAMLRDPIGGAAVNLVPSDKPQDIYQIVADRVADTLGLPVPDGKERLWAETWLSTGIDRKITKRPVMVLPYGGTFMSCVEYVGEACRDKFKRIEGGDPFGEEGPKAVGFLSKIIWAEIGNTVVAARKAMAWLQKIARICTRYGVEDIQWATPTGFIVKQRYVKLDRRRVRTELMGSATFLSFREEGDELHDSKQALALSPNFVHALDASAMMLTIDKALDAGITNFAMIHDSYGTHAADAEEFSRLIREAFVEMYKQHDVLAEFLEDIKTILPEEAHSELPPLPEKGNLIIDDVLRSDFFFS